MKNPKIRFIVAFVLIALGVGGRLIRIHYFPGLYNVEPFTAMSLLAGAMLGGGYALTVPLSMVALSDMVIGNTPIMIFTWSAWAVIGILGMVLCKRKSPTIRFSLELTGMGIVASLFFYLWTNFGVWLIDGIYAHTFAGLLQSYIMGLPFLKNDIYGNLVIVPVVSLAAILVWKTARYYNQKRTKEVAFHSNI